MRKLKLFSLLLMLLVGFGQMWAAVGDTYTQITGKLSKGTHEVLIAVGNYDPSGTATSGSTYIASDKTNGTQITLSAVTFGGSAGAYTYVCTDAKQIYTIVVDDNGDITSAKSSDNTNFSPSTSSNKLVTTVSGMDVEVNGNCYRWSKTSGDNTYHVCSQYSYNLRAYKNKCGSAKYCCDLILLEVAASTTVATPTFSVTAGTYASAQNVELACETEGSTIYYTTDGTAPTNESTKYTAAISVSESQTIKAIAYVGSDASSVATAAYTILTPQTTMDQIFAVASADEGAAKSIAITFNNWVVSGAKGNTAYVTDGTKGFIVYYSGHGFQAGDILSGTAIFTIKLFNGAAELTAKLSGTVTATTGGTATLNVLDADGISALSGINTGSLIKISGEATSASEVAGVTLYKTIYPESSLPSLTVGHNYNCTGVYVLFNSTKEILPRSAADIEEVVEEGAPEAPAFDIEAGEYTEVQNVTITCATEGAAIYYTIDGTTPSSASTLYEDEPVEVATSLTLKAIAIKNDKESSVTTATYVINIPVSEELQKTWDLSVVSCDANPTDELMTWTATYVTMSNAKGSGTKVTNYYPGTTGKTYTSTRFYNGNTLTITPNGKQLTTIVFTATSDSYATALANSTWTNATASASSKTVTVTATNGENAISAAIGATCGFTAVQVNYIAIDQTKPATPTFSPEAGSYTSVQSVEISCETEGATIYYTTDGTNPTSGSTQYTEAISVDANMTIKAIAIKDEKSSNIGEAAYVINIVDETTTKTWDLTIDETATASADELTWTATYVDMSVTSGTAAANNYYPGTEGKNYTETRFYNGATLTITPKGKQITSIVIAAGNGTPFKNASWTNGVAVADGNTVTVTVSAPGEVTAELQANAVAYSVQVNYGPIDPSLPVAPTFSPAAGTYSSVQSVELACETEGATIYYTTDGTAPTSASTAYTSAIEVNEDMTIKAVAIKDDKVGPVATAVYKINLPLTTMEAILTRANDIGSTAQEVNIQFSNWVVSGVGTDELTVYVTDGSKGFIIYGSDHGFEVNDKLNGTIACNLKLFNKVAEVVDLKANEAGLTVTKDGEVSVAEIALADLAAVNTGALIALSNMKYDGTYLTDGTTSIKPYNSLYADAEFVENKYYNVTGIYVHYNTTKEIAPRSAADIEELQATAPAMQWYVSNTKEETIGASHIIRVGDTFAPFFETNSNGALTFTSSDPTIAEIDENTGVLTLKDVVGSTTITCVVAADVDQNLLADSKSFTLQVKAQPTVGDVVVLAQLGEKWYALQNATGVTSGSLLAVEVNYSEGKIWDMPEDDQASITWKRTIDGEDVTFQDANNKYLKGTSSGAGLTLENNATNWNWYEDGGYYRIGESERTFFVNYATGNDEYIFKNFALSNLNKTNYSDLAVVTNAVFDVTPEPVEPDYETVREELVIGRHYTVCLEKNVTAVKGATFWSLTYRNAAGTEAYLVEEHAPFTAGTPYIYQATADKLEVIYGTETADEAGTNGALVGTFALMNQTAIDLAAENYDLDGSDIYMLSQNELHKVNGRSNNTIAAHRAYIVYDALIVNTPNPAPGKRVKGMPMHQDQATGVDELNAAEAPVKMIIDGQLFILRGEKMYDATGRLVK